MTGPSAQRAPSRSLAIGFMAVTLSFIGATASSQYYAMRIDKPALAIAGNAAPSIRHLATARSELHALQVALDEQLHRLADGVGVDPREIRQAQQRIDAVVNGHLAAADRLLRAIDLDARHSAALAIEVEQLRRTSLRVAIVLHVLSALAAIAVALLVRRAVRAYSRLLQSRNELLADKAAELEAFAGRVAHDILSPLGAVGLALEAAALSLAPGRPPAGGGPAPAPTASKRAEWLERGRAALASTTRVVDDLLAFARSAARPEPGARASLPVVVAAVVAELEPEAAAAEATLVIEEVPEVEVACAPGVLTSLITNLVQNALKYLASSSQRRVTLRARRRDGQVRIEVADTGPGIAPELQERIFLPHVRAPGATQPGLGLGLATVRRLAEAHGGSTGVRSQPGRGSLFWVELPAAAPAPHR